jgi:glycosyltransferase involved in cell wall biosynthesis
MSIHLGIVVNYGGDFARSRIRFAHYLIKKGYEVTAIVPADGHSDSIREAGIPVLELRTDGRGKGFANKLGYLRELKRVFKANHFDIIHFRGLQNSLIGTPVAALYSNAKIVNHITGLGISFSSSGLLNWIIQVLIKAIYQIESLLFKPNYIFQNSYDNRTLGIRRRLVIVKGSAVNEDRFDPGLYQRRHPEVAESDVSPRREGDELIFLFVSRLLYAKGVMDLIAAFQHAQDDLPPNSRLWIVGWSDHQNPSAVSVAHLEEITRHNQQIEILGRRTDIPELIAMSDVGILPTRYREGTPRFMLESMAMSRAIITTNMPGCDHLVHEEENGILVEPGDRAELQQALLDIARKDYVRMGKRGREIYFEDFSEEVVYSGIQNFYAELV